MANLTHQMRVSALPVSTIVSDVVESGGVTNSQPERASGRLKRAELQKIFEKGRGYAQKQGMKQNFLEVKKKIWFR